ncbi:hypothetical protein BS47DRAFT_1309126, partial [Hydnum rufescens UP504]
WAPLRDAFADAMLRCDGCGDSISLACPDCGGPADKAIYRCEECMLDELLCQSCWKDQHARLPFHRIKKWTGSLFEKVHLADLGIHIQFGHTSCLLPKEIPSGLVVVHVNGLHLLHASYCGCSHTHTLYEQLFHHGLFPATTSHPKMCATFQVLRHFHIQSLQSKISTIHFFQVLERETDNTGLSFHKVSTLIRSAYMLFLSHLSQPLRGALIGMSNCVKSKA